MTTLDLTQLPPALLAETKARFANTAQSQAWLTSPHRLLDGQVPAVAAQTPTGLRQALALVRGISRGIGI